MRAPLNVGLCGSLPVHVFINSSQEFTYSPRGKFALDR